MGGTSPITRRVKRLRFWNKRNTLPSQVRFERSLTFQWVEGLFSILHRDSKQCGDDEYGGHGLDDDAWNGSHRYTGNCSARAWDSGTQ